MKINSIESLNYNGIMIKYSLQIMMNNRKCVGSK